MQQTVKLIENSYDNISLYNQFIEHGRHVILAEAAAMHDLATSITNDFAKAVELLLKAHGRIIVSGIGKSGHVGRKIAATLASTGSSAFFIHPAEAAHGDLGMMMGGDVMIAISFSGRTRELLPMIAYAKTLDVPVIVITSQKGDILTKEALLTLRLPELKEACPANIAPTTSTTLTMALGDALAVSMMRYRGFSRDGFKLLHPGGEIGFRLQSIGRLMHEGEAIPLVDAEEPMREVLVTMSKKSFGTAGVINKQGELLGVITDGDLRRHADHLMESMAKDVMTCDPVTMRADDLAEDALILMNERRITSLFILGKNGKKCPVGLLHIHDLMRMG
ncbi:KpsF/GutQ family sugar-phosphate isomerase [Zymomonas mobilis]|uniref:KpsF/GutQ family protein n=1 Tax=Zymomonas mobilis subsp. pomaceae (strain ATCC 29192 / DSM 22645 / JCM 10191 / CCUG 17912 / NBRC 13757 / NCIMB 11200 / NRRL B-4491 / Barker I) TaxID=579138 RepID=F8EW49_ZYMMT|nr:KpsF/GutQ family sugar-phosphate isomerase [Zymomonas mobilis]AEI38459.1 KpsF/GutQ family protein [Zymomonas mobilis subsp. pomaceae ATCC 29192]MDX5948148.1 KpsF/GutQ family sugar-phosphate isomerase [Zymomonas mobilis subsp. pomaceae]GEB89741.1 KpsF/GutQ family protein [Zymomonas mobilis subsp. pomaceae]